MVMGKLGRYRPILIAIILVAGYFFLGDIGTAWAQEIGFAGAGSEEGYYVGRNTRRLFGFAIIGLAIFGAVKGWRQAVVLGSFLSFLGLASYGLFTFGRLISLWLNSVDSKLLPALVFIVVGMLLTCLLHKLYRMMNAFLKEHLYK